MTLGDITLHKAVDGSEYIQFGERNSKMRDGTYRDDSRATAPQIFAMGGDRDPVQFYKSYINHRPADSMTLQYDGELIDDEHQEYCRYLTSSSHMSTSTETVRSTDGKCDS